MERLFNYSLSTIKMWLSGVQKSFPSVCSRIFLFFNNLLRSLNTDSNVYKFRRSFSEEGTAGEYDGFFRQTGFQAVLKAKYCEKVENVSPFLGAIKRRWCGQSNEAPVRSVSTHYVRLTNEFHGQNRRSGCTCSELICFELSIRISKKCSVQLFGTYQTSALRATKLHMLDYLI